MNTQKTQDVLARLHNTFARNSPGADNLNYMATVTLQDLKDAIDVIQELSNEVTEQRYEAFNDAMMRSMVE
jgi:hypothetical protein